MHRAPDPSPAVPIPPRTGPGTTSPRPTLTVHHPRPDRVLVRVHGDVDLDTVDDLRRALTDGVGSDTVGGRAPDVVVCDLGGVTFLGAIGVGALVEADETARRCGARLVLVATTRPVVRVLRMCGLDRQLPIVSRLADVLDQAHVSGLPEVPAPRDAS
ncbi:STAS domain-containing protein [Actinomycetospora lemnae]|uniref:STAS domain-containing protein n=1 Tax=Actinomycetospora lemnae TaxID=3019891 RepID=UPI002FCD0E9E